MLETGNSWTKGSDLLEMRLGSAESLQGKGAQDKLLKLYSFTGKGPGTAEARHPEGRSAGRGGGGYWKEEDFLHTLGDYLRMCSTKTVE